MAPGGRTPRHFEVFDGVEVSRSEFGATMTFRVVRGALGADASDTCGGVRYVPSLVRQIYADEELADQLDRERNYSSLWAFLRTTIGHRVGWGSNAPEYCRVL